MPPGLVSAQRHLQKSAFHLNPLIAYVYMGLAMRIGLRRAKEVTQAVYREVQRTRVLNMAAGLSYYFLLSLFPLLIVLATLLGYLPIPNLFNHSMDFAARFVPSEAMGLVRRILQSVLTPNRGGLLSIGLVGTLWAASGGFSAMIDALPSRVIVPRDEVARFGSPARLFANINSATDLADALLLANTAVTTLTEYR